jgi:hypothetical protein
MILIQLFDKIIDHLLHLQLPLINLILHDLQILFPQFIGLFLGIYERGVAKMLDFLLYKYIKQKSLIAVHGQLIKQGFLIVLLRW